MSDHSQQHVLCLPRAAVEFYSAEIAFEPWAKLPRERWPYLFLRRDLAEVDETCLQVIPYIVILGYIGGSLHWLTYWRQKDASEARLAGKRSIGIGGHIDLTDVIELQHPVTSAVERVAMNSVSKELPVDMLQRAALRELHEEVGTIFPAEALMPVSLFYVGTSPVGRVHLGVLFSLVTEPVVIKPGPELYEPAWLPPRMLHAAAEMEDWSQAVLERYASGIPAICR